MRDIDHWAALVQEAEDGYAALTKQDDAGEITTPSSRIPPEKYKRLTMAQLLVTLKKNVAPYEKDFTVKFVNMKTGKANDLAVFSTRVDPESDEVQVFYDFR